MDKDRTIGGAADAIERTKNSGYRAADDAATNLENVYDNTVDRAKRVYGDAKDIVQEGASDAYDFVGEALRAGEAHVRRRPMQSMLTIAALGFVAGWLFRR